MKTPSSENVLDRRQLLTGIGALGLGGLAGARPLAGVSAAGPLHAAVAGSLGAAHPAARVLQRMCLATPANFEGPFYLPLQLLRKNITEGKPGFPMTCFFLVVDKDDCSPVEGLAVDLWHASADGQYSGLPVKGTTGETWLRGYQVTPANGLVCFETVFPGWYPGRVAHFHLKIYDASQQAVLTTQLYFEDFVHQFVYGNVPPYDVFGPSPVNNSDDAFFTPETVQIAIANPDGSASGWCGTIIGI